MENTVDALSGAYDEFVTAVAGVLQARKASGGERTAETDAALENFHQRWELFVAACDMAEEFVDSQKKRLAWEDIVAEAAAIGPSGPAAPTQTPEVEPHQHGGPGAAAAASPPLSSSPAPSASKPLDDAA